MSSCREDHQGLRQKMTSPRTTSICQFHILIKISFLLAVTFLTLEFFYTSFESKSYTSKNLRINRSQCNIKQTDRKWKSLNFTIKRTTKLFLKLEDFFWRRNASQLPSPYLFNGSQLMLLKVLAATANDDMPAQIENLECRKCVVVGNSFAIKNTALGSAINKYDVVVRLNNAPVRGYENDVGHKTTMRIFYPESAISDSRLHNDEDTLMVMVPFKPHDLRWLKEMLYDEKRDRRGFWKPPPLIWLVDSSKVRVLDPHFMHQTMKQMVQVTAQKRNQKSFRPTTGFLAVYVALSYCDVVHLAGFGYPPTSDQQQPIHYFENYTMKAMKDSPHDINHEAQALKRLEEIGALMYLHPHL